MSFAINRPIRECPLYELGTLWPIGSNVSNGSFADASSIAMVNVRSSKSPSPKLTVGFRPTSANPWRVLCFPVLAQGGLAAPLS
jgi:hypothetical protein